MRERLNVFCAGRQVGVLEYDDVRRCFAFSYDAGYLASEEAMPISLSLPLQEEPAGVLESRYFFENLLPPEIVRRRLEKIIHVSWDNVFGMLKALGGDCAGAISLYAEGQGPEFESERLRELTDDEADEVLKLLPQRPLLVDRIDGYRISGSGAQDKLIARIVGGRVVLPLYGAPSTHILKPEIARLHDTVANECFCQKLATEAGLLAADSGIIGIRSSAYYWTRRFDRLDDKGTIRRLHQEDFCQAMRYDPEKKYEFEGGPSVARCLNFLRESALGVSEMMRFLDDFIYHFLIGNADAHAKNYAILYKEGRPTVAPVYDAMCTAVYHEVPTAMAMRIGDVREMADVRREQFATMAERAKIRPQLVHARLDALAETLPQKAVALKERLSDEGHPSPVYDEIIATIRRHVAQTNG